MDPAAPDADELEPDAKPESPAVEPFERRFPDGAVVFEEGSEGRSLFVIQSGAVELSRPSTDGRRLVARHGPGEFFGEMSVVLGQSRSARAVAVGETRLLEIAGSTFETMCVDQPEIAIRVIQRLAVLGVDDLLRPVVRVLLRHAEAADDGHRVDRALRPLAEEAGLALLDAHRALGQLFDRKLIRLADDVLRIPSLEALSASLD